VSSCSWVSTRDACVQHTYANALIIVMSLHRLLSYSLWPFVCRSNTDFCPVCRHEVEHSEGVDCITKLDEDTVLVGCSDSSVRAVHILPNEETHHLGHHAEGGEGEEGLSIEGMALNHSCTILATVAHDEYVQLWDLQKLLNGGDNSPGVLLSETPSRQLLFACNLFSLHLTLVFSLLTSPSLRLARYTIASPSTPPFLLTSLGHQFQFCICVYIHRGLARIEDIWH
jgi:hypothetical protein